MSTAILALAVILMLLIPTISSAFDASYYRDVAIRIMIFGIAAVSLDLILGFGGMVSFGHAAYLGLGSYAVGILSYYGITNGVLHFVAAFLLSGVAAALIGVVSLRTSGVYFIMITLAFSQMLYFLAVSLSEYGGDDGLQISKPSDFGGVVDLSNPTTLYLVVFGLLCACVFISHCITRSHYGMILQGIRSNEKRMKTLGYNCLLYKLIGFVIAGAMCGVGGALLANQSLFVSPSIMHWTRSGEIMVMVILGGVGTVFGAAFGAAAVLLAEDVLSGITQHWQIIFGPLLIVIFMFARRGLWGTIFDPREDHVASPTHSRFVSEMSDGQTMIDRQRSTCEALTVDGLRKNFGGIIAAKDLSLKVREGDLHAIIGPNGAGKTTLVSQLSGEIRPDAGSIHFEGRDITHASILARCRAGIARTYQITSVFMEFSALLNVALAIQVRCAHKFNFWRPLLSDLKLIERSKEYLRLVGLDHRHHIRVGDLSHGERRALEIALALATAPRLVLLDEPMAGMSGQDSRRIIDLLLSLKRKFTIVLVEHDMDAVFALADEITVLVYGQAVASGSPTLISQNPEVRAAYLAEPVVEA
jgi:ABC-type branched-subunit amino acid transport system ATPase component/ABC-type branched-subunit amino acid transport system permease subunit